MGFPLPIPATLRETVPPGTSVLVALSGGVDSSVALALLHELDCELFAVTFKNFCYGDDFGEKFAEENARADKSCCSLGAIEDARRIAHRFSSQHWVHDVTDLFRDAVIDPFVAEYVAGRTPNPCLSCNATVRFPALVRLAEQLGIERVATGHYARMEFAEGSYRLLRGVDEEKDQAYFLYRIERSLFPRILFPLGWYRKTEVREAARALSLPVASKHESQEICFVPNDDRSFLFSDHDPVEPGDIVDRSGTILGRHQGLVHYTVGQRRGLGIAAAEPLYVLALDRIRNRLVVGSEPELAVRRIICDSIVASVDNFPDHFPDHGSVATEGRCHLARIRHRHAGALVKSWTVSENRLDIELAETVKGVAPGQSVVLYEDEVVLGGGRIIGSE